MIRGICKRIVLIDKQTEKAEAEAADLQQGLMFVRPVRIEAADLSACRDADVIVITAGAKQKPGQSRLDLAGDNVEILRELVPRLVRINDAAIILMVSNPVDVLTYVTWRLSGLPDGRVIGSGTVLDTSRFRVLIARKLGISVANIHAYIVGEHGDSEVPLWSSARVSNVRLSDFRAPGHPHLTSHDFQEIFERVRNAAAEIIAAKGATNWAVGLACSQILGAIIRDERTVLPVSRVLTGQYDLSGLSLSLPCIVGTGGAEPPLPLALDEHELAALRSSAAVIRSTIGKCARDLV